MTAYLQLAADSYEQAQEGTEEPIGGAPEQKDTATQRSQTSERLKEGVELPARREQRASILSFGQQGAPQQVGKMTSCAQDERMKVLTHQERVCWARCASEPYRRRRRSWPGVDGGRTAQLPLQGGDGRRRFPADLQTHSSGSEPVRRQGFV